MVDDESVKEEYINDPKFKEIWGLIKPTYDGKYLHSLARDILGEKRLGDALINVIIPAYW